MSRKPAAALTLHFEKVAVVEKRPVPFVNGRFVGKQLPKGIRYRTVQEFVEAW